MPEQIIRQRRVEDSLGYFVTLFTERAADTNDIELGGITIALGMTVARAKDELTRLRAELEPYEVLTEQACQAEKHPTWLIDSENHHACPWCEIERLKAEKAGPGAAELAGRLNSAEAQLCAVDQRYSPVHEAVAAWRTGELTADQAMQQIAKAVGRAA